MTSWFWGGHWRSTCGVWSRCWSGWRRLEWLKEAGLKLKPAKCHFLKQSVKYLSHVICAQEISPDPKKVQAFQMLPCPRTSKTFGLSLMGCHLTTDNNLFHISLLLSIHCLHSLTKICHLSGPRLAVMSLVAFSNC